MRRSPLLTLVLVLVAACGGSPTPAPDGIHGTDAGPPGSVRVTVTRGAQTVSGLTVYFLGPDDAVITSGTTDAGGQASALIPAGGSVTVVEPQSIAGAPNVFGLVTWLAVQAGDELALELPAPFTSTTVDVTVGADTSSGISDYSVLATCGGALVAAGTATPIQLGGCSGELATTDFIVFARDAQGHPVDALVALDTPVADKQAVSLTGAYAPVGSLAASYTNVPARFTDSSIEAELATKHGVLSVADAEQLVATGTISASLAVPARATGTQVVNLGLGQSGVSGQELVSWGPVSASFTLDTTGQVLQDYTTRPVLDVVSQRVTWDVGGSGATPGVSIATLGIDHGQDHQFLWTVVAPGDAPAMTLPVLPTDLDSFHLTTGDEGAVQTLQSVLAPGGSGGERASVLGPSGPFTSLFGFGIGSGDSGEITIETLAGVPL